MKTSAGNYAIITLVALLSSIVLFGITIPSLFLAFLSGYFLGISSPESKMNAEYAKLMAGNESKTEHWANNSSFSADPANSWVSVPDTYKEDE